MRKRTPAPVQTTASALVPQSQHAAPQLAKILINPITVEGTDPLLADRANAIRLGATEILRNTAGIQLTDSTGPDVMPFGATLRTSTAGPEMLPQAPAGAVAVPVPDAASGIRAVLDWVAAQAHVAVTGLSQSPEALNQYAAAVTTTATDPAKADVSLKASLTADPGFLPAQLLAMRYFTMRGDAATALAAAKQIMALDPSNLDAARMAVALQVAGQKHLEALPLEMLAGELLAPGLRVDGVPPFHWAACLISNSTGSASAMRK